MLDVAIGLSLVFAIFAGLVSGMNEILAQVLGWRGEVLREGVSRMLDGDAAGRPRLLGWLGGFFFKSRVPKTSAAGEVYETAIVKTLSQGNGMPSYLPASAFSAALVQWLSRGGSFAALRQRLEDRSKHLGELLGPMLDESNGDVEVFKRKVEEQFDAVMERAEGWYKRRTQFVMAGLGLLLAVALNLDVLHVARRLNDDAALRGRLVDAAMTIKVVVPTLDETPAADDPAAATKIQNQQEQLLAQQQKLEAGVQQLASLGVPIGWESHGAVGCVPLKLLNGQTFPGAILGWVLAALTATLGAPFWFDALSRLVSLRGAGKKPDAVSVDSAKPAGPAPTSALPPVVGVETPPRIALNDFEASRLDGEDIAALQRALGVGEDRVDGVLRDDLRAALREWQRVTGRTPTGRFDEPTVLALLYPK